MAFRMLNSHHIRRSFNVNVLFRQLEQMFHYPELWNAENHIKAVSEPDLTA